MHSMFKSKFRIFLISLTGVAAMLTSCEEKYRFQIADDPGYDAVALESAEALDGDIWIQGAINHEEKTISFTFHKINSLKKVPVRLHLAKEWSYMVNPVKNFFEADLSTSFRTTLNDGVDDAIYRINGEIYPLVAAATVTQGEYSAECSVSAGTISGTMQHLFRLVDLKDVDVNLTLTEGTEMITPASKLQKVDFSEGKPLEVALKDGVSGQKKTVRVYVNPADVVTLSSDWKEITVDYIAEYNLTATKNLRIYQTNSLNGYSGNIGYLFTVPAGQVQMKLIEKSQLSSADNSKISAVVRNNPDYTVFIPMNGPGVWHTDGSTSSSNLTYLSPLAFGPDKNGNKTVLRQEGFGGSQAIYAPALAIKDGKAYIAPAKTDKAAGKLYRYTDVKGSGEQDWSDVDCAWGGYFQVVYNGQCLISNEGSRYYESYNNDWRAIQSLTTYTTTNWDIAQAITLHDSMRNGRHGVGVTEKGDLVILSVEKFVNTHNQGQNVDDKHDGGSGDRRGLTLYELAKVMSGLGCSDAMTLEDYATCGIVLQDGSGRGHDLFWTNNRWYLTTSNPNYGTMKPEGDEYQNLTVACFK